VRRWRWPPDWGSSAARRELLEHADFSDAQFTLDLLAKDLGLVLEESRGDAARMPVTVRR
jgi:3-hydroxyisobutyrate dehydrogenase-like beta-hydroxyacid dehydrogenase